MNPREWALVAFTLLMQTSVGVLLVVVALQPFVSRGPMHGSARPFDLPLLIAGAAAVLGLLASLSHLGHPLQAWLALTNVRTSWLSREVVLAVLFAIAGGLFTALFRSESGSPVVRGVVCVLAVVLGVAAVFAMSRLYMVSAQPAWNRVATPIGFFATTLLLGTIVVVMIPAAMAVGATHASPLQETVGRSRARWLLLITIALLAMQVLLIPAHLAALVREPAAAISAGSVGHAATWLVAGRALAAVAAVVLLVGMLRGMPGALSPAAAGIATLVLVFVSELLGRVLFYAASVHLGPA
jgi:anaerobic dimethyl sulfoxide reductase subunit C (anchor subunit)